MEDNKDLFLIVEDGSVSDTVTNMIEDLYIQLYRSIEKSKLYVAGYRNLVVKKGFFAFDTRRYLENVASMDVSYVVYFTHSKEEYDMIKSYGWLDCVGNYQDKKFILNIGYIDNKPAPGTKGAIGHEVEHVFQMDKGQLYDVDLYNVVTEKYYKGEMWERVVARALYRSFQVEQDAFVNEFYVYVKCLGVKPDTGKVHHDNNPYDYFLNAFNEVKNLNLNDNDMLKSFGMTVKGLYTRLNAADKRLHQKMLNIWTKYCRDRMGESLNYQRFDFMLECMKKGINETVNELI